MSVIERILELLEDGTWHDLREIAEKSQLHDLRVKMVAEFLAEYNFINLDKEGQKAKLVSSTLDFLRKIRQMEGKEVR